MFKPDFLYKVLPRSLEPGIHTGFRTAGLRKKAGSMPSEEQLQAGFVLGAWEILPAKGVFRREGEEVRPEPLLLRVLFSLATRDGDLVTRDELIDDAWGGRPTADDPINRAIAQLRKLLGDTNRPPEYVETLHRRGYRLIKPVVLLEKRVAYAAQADEGLADKTSGNQRQADPPESDQPPTAEPVAGVSGTSLTLRLWKFVAATLAFGFIAIAVNSWIQTRIPVRSIAVMPFENLSGRRSDEYLVLGFKEELVHALHSIDDVIVKNGRVNYDDEPGQIAETLEVESVLFGSLRRNGNSLKINYTISKGRKGVVHSGEIEGTIDELISLQESLAHKVRDDLVGKSSQVLFKSRPTDSTAYDSYMRGIYALEHRGDAGKLEAAIELFQDSIRLDLQFGPAYLALATAYALTVDYRKAPLAQVNKLAIETVEDGIAADPIIADAAGAIYGFVYHKEKRWGDSERAYLRAVNAGVVDSNAFNWYSRMLASVGRLDDALEQGLLALEIDPGSPIINSRVAITYTWLLDSENANEYFERSVALGNSGTTHILAYALLLARDGQMEQARTLTHSNMQSAGLSSKWIEPIFDAFDDVAKAPEALRMLNNVSETQRLPPQVDITVRTMLGDIEGAMRAARQLELPGEVFEMELLFIPELKPLRQHPEFMPLLEKLGVVAYWQANDCVWRSDRVACKTD